MQNERILVVVLMIAGFLWLRRRGRRLDEASRGRALIGSVLFLVPVLIGGRWLLDRLPYGRIENLVIELIGIAAVIAFAGYVFMTPAKKSDDAL
jgi:hypothetical protein